jgi:hypothetical protein
MIPRQGPNKGESRSATVLTRLGLFLSHETDACSEQFETLPEIGAAAAERIVLSADAQEAALVLLVEHRLALLLQREAAG